ncbi:MAG: DEAD/DEAH box helicase [Hyphomicrobiaceae bacterium]|nr:MAG: DEAD/DEAH box helicase [Hyphomicrobiaceae bacterium]
MKLTKINGTYILLDCKPSEQFAPRGAGFVFHHIVPGYWATLEPRTAARLLEFSDDTCRHELSEIMDGMKKTAMESIMADSTFSPPAPDGLTYMPFQRAGAKFLVERKSVLLADEMGLGKTVQSIAAINYLTADVEDPKILIVCPAFLKLNWKYELDRWLTFKWPISIIKGTSFEFRNIAVINYDILKRNLDSLKAVKWDILIADEAHAIKNQKAQRTRALLAIEAERKYLLTGTPVMNRPEDLWTILKYLDPATWHNWYYFVTRYCGAKKGKYQLELEGPSNLEELNERLRTTVMIRRLKSQVLPELPPKMRQIVEIPCSDPAMIEEQNRVVEDAKQKAIELKALIAQAATHPDDASFREKVKGLREMIQASIGQLAILRHKTALYKVDPLLHHIANVIEEHKVIVFAHHRDVLEKLAEPFNADIIWGGIKDTERQRMATEFCSDGGKRIIVVGIMAGGVGINLTSASHVIFAELDWTPARLSQAEDRAHRIGQKDNVFVQHFVVEGSVDSKIAKIVVNKQEIIDKVVDNHFLNLDGEYDSVDGFIDISDSL